MEYVCTGATLKCTMGTSCPKLKATPKDVTLTGKDQANIADYVSMKNIPSFGRCRSLGYPPTASATAANHGRLTPMPCVPGTCPKWKAIDNDSLLCGEPALLKPATLKCKYGGTISIISSGQSLEVKGGGSKQTKSEKSEKKEQEIPEELLQEFNELDTEGLKRDSVLDGVQLALDAAGMVPVLGAVPDLINASISALRGDWVGAGLSIVAAVPGVGDVVGGAKIAYKGVKIASKSTKITKVKSVPKIAQKHSDNSQIKNGSTLKQNHSNASDVDFNKGSFTDKERSQLREIRAKRAGVKPEEMQSEILYDRLPNSEGNNSQFLNLTMEGKINSGTAKAEIPDIKINPNAPNIFIPSAEVKPINTNTMKDYEMTKEAMKNAENKVLGKNLDIEG